MNAAMIKQVGTLPARRGTVSALKEYAGKNGDGRTTPWTYLLARHGSINVDNSTTSTERSWLQKLLTHVLHQLASTSCGHRSHSSTDCWM